MFTPHPIGFVSSPYKETTNSKGPGRAHDARRAEDSPEFEPDSPASMDSLTSMSFGNLTGQTASNAGGFELVGTPPTDDRPHGVFATRSPRRPNPIGLTVVELLGRDGNLLTVAASTCSTEHDPRHQALSFKHSRRPTAAWMAGRGGSGKA